MKATVWLMCSLLIIASQHLQQTQAFRSVICRNICSSSHREMCELLCVGRTPIIKENPDMLLAKKGVKIEPGIHPKNVSF